MVPNRRPIIAGNWKMYKTPVQTREYFHSFLPRVAGSNHCEILICPSFLCLQTAVEAAHGSNVDVAGQDLFWVKEGAYTGEVSGEMLKSAGCRGVLVAHSERRQHFCETDHTAYKKVVAAIEASLTPIICVGEVLAERESGRTEQVLHSQFHGSIARLTPEQFAHLVIAYEPVWAIGTGKTASPAMAAEAHGIIRSLVASHMGAEAAASIRILYGGSVKPENIVDLMTQDEIDGALVGGASLDPVSFASIVNYGSSKT